MSKVSKKRLDIVLMERGLVETRAKGRGLILAGEVYVNGIKVDKAGTIVDINVPITIKEESIGFVSRGGLKLQKALDIFEPPIKDKIFVDIGSSTGGFTDCLLKRGARKVYAIDVGYGQLAWSLRQDPRVIVMERTNIRDVDSSYFQDTIQGAVIDVAFISLKLVLPVLRDILVSKGHIIALVKPQFEAGRENVGKKGVVRIPEIHRQVLFDIITFSQSIGFNLMDMTFSPITGPKGNIEYLIHLYYKDDYNLEGSEDIIIHRNELQNKIDETVEKAHKVLT